MKVYDYLADKAEKLQSHLKYVTNDLEYAMQEVTRLKELQEEVLEELKQFDEFFDKREAIEDAISSGDSRILSVPPTEEL